MWQPKETIDESVAVKAAMFTLPKQNISNAHSERWGPVRVAKRKCSPKLSNYYSISEEVYFMYDDAVE